MAISATYIALTIAVVGTAASLHEQNIARKDARYARDQQVKAQGEQKAQNAAEAAIQRRQQIREERVRRARILQAGENTGTDGSSGEAGALGSLDTTFSNNIGFAQGRFDSAVRQSNFLQDAANANYNSQQAQSLASTYGQVASLAGSFTSFASKPSTPTPTKVNIPAPNIYQVGSYQG